MIHAQDLQSNFARLLGRLWIGWILVAFSLAAAPAWAERGDEVAFEAGIGAFGLASKVTPETSKSGFVFPGYLRSSFGLGPSFYGVLGLGAALISIGGEKSGVSQSINQIGLFGESSVYGAMASSPWSIGVGVRHFFAQGAGLQYRNPEEWSWAFYFGPRVQYEFARSRYSVGLSYDASLNLPVGNASFWLLSIVYRFGDRLIQGPIQQQSKPEPEMKSAREAPSDPVLVWFTPEKLESIEFVAETEKLLPRATDYLSDLVAALRGSRESEWSIVEIQSSIEPLRQRRAKALEMTLIDEGIAPDRIRVEVVASERPTLAIQVSHLGMRNYLRSKEASFHSRFVRIKAKDFKFKPSVLQALRRYHRSWASFCLLTTSAETPSPKLTALRLQIQSSRLQVKPLEVYRFEGAAEQVLLEVELKPGDLRAEDLRSALQE